MSGSLVQGSRVDEYERNRKQPDLNTAAATDSPGDTATIDKTVRMASNLTMSIHHPALSRRTSDSAYYTVLLDILPVGSRCYKPKGPRKGACDLPETTRNIALECPFSALAQETVLRATLQAGYNPQRQHA